MPDVLSRLETLGPSMAVEPGAPTAAPMTHREGFRRWLASLDVRPGLTLSPGASHLARIFAAYAEAQGWRLDALDGGDVGRLMRAAGLESSRRAGHGYLVNRDAAAELWRAVGVPRPKRSGTRTPRPRPDRRVTRHATRPIRTCDGRMWTQRGLAEALGVTTLAVSRIVAQGTALRGLHARFATPEEVRLWRAQADEWDGGVPSPS